MAHPRDVAGDLVSGQLPALSGLGALGDLDLQLVRVGQVPAGHTEPARRHLLDRAAPPVAAGVALEALGILTALAAVALAADAVHGDGERLVYLGADRAQRHCT